MFVRHEGDVLYQRQEWSQRATGPAAGRSEPLRGVQSGRQPEWTGHFPGGEHLTEEETCYSHYLFIICYKKFKINKCFGSLEDGFRKCFTWTRLDFGGKPPAFLYSTKQEKLRDGLEVVNGAKSAKQKEKLHPTFCLLLCLISKCIDKWNSFTFATRHKWN